MDVDQQNPAQSSSGMNLMDPTQASIHLYTATWARESHGLFDYEARNPIKKSYIIQNASTILRRGTDVTVSDNSTYAVTK